MTKFQIDCLMRYLQFIRIKYVVSFSGIQDFGGGNCMIVTATNPREAIRFVQQYYKYDIDRVHRTSATKYNGQ